MSRSTPCATTNGGGCCRSRSAPTPATAATAAEDRRTLAFILRAKEHGFTLKEIAGLLAHVTAGIDDAPAAVRAAAAAKLEALHEQRRELDSIAARLERLLQLCDDGDAENCASLAADPCRA